MQHDVNNLCINCFFGTVLNGTCDYCGFSENSYNVLSSHVAPKTVLMGKYVIGRVLSEDKFGVTYLGFDISSNSRVSIRESHDPDRFLKEAENLARFRGTQGMVSILDYFTENSKAFIVTEFVDGVTFGNYCTEYAGAISSEQIFNMLEPVIYSLASAHSVGVVHGNINAENIIVTSNAELKLINFFSGESNYYNTDVYAVCAVIYKIITGIDPSTGLQAPSALGINIDSHKEQVLLSALAGTVESMNDLLVGFYQTPAYSNEQISQPNLTPQKKKPLGLIIGLSSAFVVAAIVMAVIFFMPSNNMPSFFGAPDTLLDESSVSQEESSSSKVDEITSEPTPAPTLDPTPEPTPQPTPDMSEQTAKDIYKEIYARATTIMGGTSYYVNLGDDSSMIFSQYDQLETYTEYPNDTYEYHFIDGKLALYVETEYSGDDVLANYYFFEDDVCIRYQTFDLANEVITDRGELITDESLEIDLDVVSEILTQVPWIVETSNEVLDPFSMSDIVEISATSSLSEYGMTHSPERTVDGDSSTAWCEGAAGNGIGESITYTFSSDKLIGAMMIEPGFGISETLYYKNSRPSGMFVEFSTGFETYVMFDDYYSSWVEIVFDIPQYCSWVKFTIDEVYSGSVYTDTLISEVEFLGNYRPEYTY